MISCNPATLARDLGILTGTLREKNGALVKVAPDSANEDGDDGYFKIESVEPFDMFPQTKHVETLVCLSKNQKNISALTLNSEKVTGKYRSKNFKKS